MSRLLVVALFCGLFITSCFNPPIYPEAPEVTFKDVFFKKGGTVLPDGGITSDSLFLIISFKDGDGDVGVGGDELYPPFNDRWFFLENTPGEDRTIPDDCRSYDKKCWWVNNSSPQAFANYVSYKDYRTKPAYSSLPPFSCLNWEVIRYDDDNNTSTADKILDTLYFEINPHYANIFVEFQEKTGDPANPYKAFDPSALCIVRPFDGRIPVLFDDVSSDIPLEGDIRYAMQSISFQTLFGGKVMRLKIYIEDRALNQSNIIFSRDFTFTE